MIRYYISKYIGTGTFLDQYRTGIDDLIGAGEKADGLHNPVERYFIRRVSAPKETHDKIIADGLGVPLTPLSETDDFNMVKLAEKTAIIDELASLNVNTKISIDINTPTQEVVRKLLYSARLSQIAKRTSTLLTKKQIDEAAKTAFKLANTDVEI